MHRSIAFIREFMNNLNGMSRKSKVEIELKSVAARRQETRCSLAATAAAATTISAGKY